MTGFICLGLACDMNLDTVKLFSNKVYSCEVAVKKHQLLIFILLLCSREELEESAKKVGDLEGRLRMLEAVKEGGNADVGFTMGVCVRCGQSEAVLPESVLASQKHSLETVTQ